MRFGIKNKLLLLIAALSLALITASVLISSRLYASSLEKNMKELCSETADSLAESVENEHIEFISTYRDKIEAVYTENREELEAAMDREFESFDKREEYYSSFTEDIFPPKSGLGLSYDALVFKGEYNAVRNEMDMLSYAGGLDTASVFIYDREHNNMVYLADRMPEGSMLYSFPASVKKPWDERMQEALENGVSCEFISGKECYALTPIDGTEGKVFALFGSFNTGHEQNVRLFSLYTFLITLGATLAIGAVMLWFANRLIVKNIKKLTAASEEFASEMHGNAPKKILPHVESKDEIGDLSDKFELMQDSILSYIERLAEKTSREEKLNAELELAARIQSESLPKGGMKTGNVILQCFLKPAKEVGGDLYDYFMLDENRLFFCLADVSGKGIPASLFMMRAKELIKAGVKTGAPLDDFAFGLNNELCAGNEESIFITAFFGVLDTVSGRLSYLRAGHELPFLKRGNEAVQFGEESNCVLGIFEDAEFISGETELQPGDTLLLFTDGLNEGINNENEAFGYDRIAQVLKTAEGDITGAMYSALLDFCSGAEQFDDVTMLVISMRSIKRMELTDPGYDDITAVTDSVLSELSGFDADRASEVGILIDEIMNNEISYAFRDTAEPKLNVLFELTGGVVKLVFEDNGTAFDPLSEVKEEDIENSEGGFGLELVKALSNGQSYERADGFNRLTVSKDML